MKNIIAELDHIAGSLEEYGEPWAYNLVWRLDRVAQLLTEKEPIHEDLKKLASVKKSILDQYLSNILFLNENGNKLEKLIKKYGSSEAEAEKIYKTIKEHFGKLDKEDSIKFIKNVLKKV